MRGPSACRTRPEQLPWPANGHSSGKARHLSGRKAGPGTPWRLLLALLACFGVSSCRGVPVMSHVLQGEKVWNEIDDMCSAIPAGDTLPRSSHALEEFCFTILEFLQKSKEELRIPGGVESRGHVMEGDQLLSIEKACSWITFLGLQKKNLTSYALLNVKAVFL
ncbi:neuromedin-U-like isoform X3 [Erythrolamprus reginae]|uniref:neuromedin-U-like isoform X3 n=1 Tax=Erythrolamprus reginae TaxID=121349 RepID=UPI00396CC1AF